MNAPGPILVIDDDDDLRRSVCDLLEEEGYRTIGAPSGEEGLAALGREHPRLVLLDLMMPGMNGWQFRAHQLDDEALARIPVVVITASRTLQANPIAAEAVLLKPFKFERLLELVQRVAAQRGPPPLPTTPPG